MDRIIDRLYQWMNYEGVSVSKLTDTCGLSVGLLSNARRGSGDIGKKSIGKILETYRNINPVWLMTGEGGMILTNPGEESVSFSNHETNNDFSRFRKGIFERLCMILAREGVSISTYEKSHRIFRGTFLNATMRADRKITIAWVDDILVDYPKYSYDWVIKGKGEMYSKEDYPNEETGFYRDELVEQLRQENAELKQEKQNLWSLLTRLKNIPSASSCITENISQSPAVQGNSPGETSISGLKEEQ